MQPIKTTEAERKLLDQSRDALNKTPEAIAFQASLDAVVALRGLEGRWTFSPDFSALIPPASMTNMTAEIVPSPAE